MSRQYFSSASSAQPSPGDGRKIADSIWAIYASRSYVQSRGGPSSIDDLKDHPLVVLDETLAGHRLTLWLASVVPQAQYAARSGSVLGMVPAAKAGVGLAALPTALGDTEEDLFRVLGPISELARDWRLLTHPDMRHHGRVQAFFDFVATRQRDLATQSSLRFEKETLPKRDLRPLAFRRTNYAWTRRSELAPTS